MGATGQQLRARAAFDLRCPEPDLQVTELDKRTRGITGCGQRATYVEHCQACANGYPACDCTGVLNTDSRPGE